MASLFVSHSSHDRDEAERIAQRLRSRALLRGFSTLIRLSASRRAAIGSGSYTPSYGRPIMDQAAHIRVQCGHGLFGLVNHRYTETTVCHRLGHLDADVATAHDDDALGVAVSEVIDDRSTVVKCLHSARCQRHRYRADQV
jgi:hypothetical protein